MAILFLAFVSFASIWYQLNEIVTSRNAFRIMGVSRTATDSEIRRAYKVGVVELHPDKNQQNPEAEELFVDFKQAYDQLLNEQYRETYDKWGSMGTEWLEHDLTDIDIFVNGLVRMAVQYGFLFGMTFLATFMSSETNARPIAFSVLLMFLSVEAQLRFEKTTIVVPFAPWFAVYQMVSINKFISFLRMFLSL